MKSFGRFATCNEVFQKASFADVCRKIREVGYEGIEIAPFTLCEDPLEFSSARRREVRNIIEAEGLRFVGLHWLMVSPAGLHVTTSDLSVRRRSWDHIRSLIDLCGDLGSSTSDTSGVLVFGSPKQRSTMGAMTPAEAREIFTRELEHVAPQAERRGVKILVEALPANQSNVINTLAEAVAIVDEIRSPAVRTMFDTHNAVDELEPHPELIRRYFDYISHVHVNEIDGREPGMGDYDFGSILATLEELGYQGWVSLEAFDFSRDPGEIISRALTHLRASLPATAA